MAHIMSHVEGGHLLAPPSAQVTLEAVLSLELGGEVPKKNDTGRKGKEFIRMYAMYHGYIYIYIYHDIYIS